ncbi:MAG TPA: two-component regulator propeller domain-containing protein [Chitinophagaceae bacterium]|nr:two-component regulator propeller domain-containing protein [Chitinophagaceae bacterium]
MTFINHTIAGRKALLLLFVLSVSVFVQAQPPSFNFHQLTTGNGLSDPVIRSITQDKYGYIWIGTSNGLNRFNGYDVKVFQHKLNDAFSLPENFVPALQTDDDGNLWVAQSKGIYKFDYNNARFIFQQGSKGIATAKMVKGEKNEIYMATGTGLVLFNTTRGSFSFLKETNDSISKILLSKPVNDFCVNSDGTIYIAADTGLIVYKRKTGLAKNISPVRVNGVPFGEVGTDKRGNVWASFGVTNAAELLKTNEQFGSYEIYRQFLDPGDMRVNRITHIFPDNKGRIWITTANSGLCLYDSATNNFFRYAHDPLQNMSISDNLITQIFQDKQGYIWLGTEGYGINYFHPDKTFFHSIQPSYNQSPTLPDYWSRAAAEDRDGNLWLGTASGLAMYNPQRRTYRIFQNTNLKKNILQHNSIRSILCDGDDVWIGTGNGLNRYHTGSGKMDFLGSPEGMPVSFFWTIIKDHTGNIWFGCRDGIYRYDQETKKFENFIHHPQLAAWSGNNTTVLYEDSRQRMWMGFYSKGVLMYNTNTGQTKHFFKNDTDSGVLSDNHITSLIEDKNGITWIATLDGLNAYDSKTDKIIHYLREKGKPSERTSSLAVDEANRLWMTGSRGLLMLNTERTTFKSFDISDGLSSVDFNNQSAFRMRNGNFIYSSFRGFVQFNPAEYADKNNGTDLYISSFKVHGIEPDTAVSFEEKIYIRLNPDENYFSFELVGINYGNPQQNWYAHKLDPFDKDWIYTKERQVSYTNVPGGDYVFRYKTSSDPSNWNTPEKNIRIFLAAVFYKTWWFTGLILLLIASILFGLYRWRINQNERVFSLQTKANSLEKEKVMVMYESLKQQLNPHFLFNSLTSLSGLITANPVNAKQFLDKMSKIYRYILTSRDHETVSLAEDIKLATIYTELQQTRFKEGLKVLIDVPEAYQHRKIAPVTIQNLIENAIKHNIIDEVRPLMVNIFIEDDHLVVQNNLQKKKFVETSNKHGLVSMQSLYNYLGGRPVTITEDENNFVVKVPLL